MKDKNLRRNPSQCEILESLLPRLNPSAIYHSANITAPRVVIFFSDDVSLQVFAAHLQRLVIVHSCGSPEYSVPHGELHCGTVVED